MSRQVLSRKRRPGGSAERTKSFNISVTPEEYELLFEAAGSEGVSGSSWGRDILITRALRARWKGQAA